MSNNTYTPEEIARFLANECTAVQARDIAAFLEENALALDQIDLFEGIKEEDIIVAKQDEKQFYLSKILHPVQVVPLWKKYLVAASLVAILLLSVLVIYRSQQQHGQNIVQKEIDYVEITNDTSHDSVINLPDHSRVVMNPKAKISYASNFGNNRSIRQLSGRVLYEVAKDSIHPFRVNLDDIVTQAVGTAFWVAKEPREIAVTLLEGKVKLNSLDPHYELKNLYLEPGQICRIDKANRKLTISHLQVEKQKIQNNKSDKHYLGKGVEGVTWSTDEVIFDQVQLHRLFDQLEQQYNVRLKVDDPYIGQKTFTGRIYATDSLETLLQAICEINGLNYSTANSIYYIKHKTKQK